MKYYNKGGIYVAIHSKGEMCVFLNEQIAITENDPTMFCVQNDYTEITHDEFCKAYKQTRAMLDSAYSRLNMMYTDGNIPQATEADKREVQADEAFAALHRLLDSERERFPVDDEHRGEYKEFDC